MSAGTTGTTGTTGATGALGGTTTVPERDFKGLDYVNDKAGEYRAALNSEVNVNSRECENSSPVDFLYLSTIRGGRKTKKMSLMNAGGCGCGLTGGVRRNGRNGRKRRNSLYGGYEGEGEGDNLPMLTTDANSEIYDTPENLGDPNIGNPNSGESESSYPNSGDPAMMGGCFTCKKGVKNITHIYSTIHIIIPTLYGKYKKGVSMKAVKIIKPIKSKSQKPKKPKK
jgi:hypothetical protein